MVDFNLDSEARLRALNPTKSFIVQAPAGSGKTELLTQRILKLLAQVDKPEEIIALTFTRKAAAEMKLRIISALLDAKNNVPIDSHKNTTRNLANEALANDRRCGWELLTNPARLNITTIDSLCAKIVKQTPVLSNIGSDIAITDDPSVYYKQAIVEVFRLVNTNSYDSNCTWTNDFKILLQHFGCNYNKLQSFLLQMLYKREQWLPYLVSSRQQGMHALIQQCWQALASDLIDNIKKLLPLDIQTELSDLLVYASNYLQTSHDVDDDEESYQYKIMHHGKNSIIYWQAVSYLIFTNNETLDFRKRLDKRLGFPSKTEFKDKSKQEHAIVHKNRLATLIQDIESIFSFNSKQEFIRNIQLLRKMPDFDYSADNWQFVLILSNILTLLEAELRIILRNSNIIDFSGMSQAANFAFDSAEDINLYFDYAISHILVDEFQDTSYTQYQLLSKLTMNWDQNDLTRIKTLFLVGDPMQSIYKFRQADVSLFLDVKNQGLGQLKLEYLALYNNFRSQQQIVDWVNDKFSQIMPARSNNLLGAVEYSQSIATKELKAELNPKLNLFSKAKGVDAYADENAYIVKTIKNIITYNTPCSIAILVRNRSKILDLVLQLKRNNIKISAVDIELLADRMVVQDLLSLTQSIIDLSDRTAWLSVLRAPWCGLTLSELYSLIVGNEHETVWDSLSRTDDAFIAFKKTKNILFVYKNVFAKLYKVKLYKLITQAWYALGGHLIYSTKEDHDDAEQFFELLFQLEESGLITDLERLKEKVSSLYSNNAKNASQGVTENYNVNIMTIHKSKGLQFDYVFLPYLDSTPRPVEHQILLWQQYHRYDFTGILLAPYYMKSNSQGKFYESLRFIDKQKENYELSRLLYVAVTRAIKACYLTGSLSEKALSLSDLEVIDSDEIKANAQSMLALLFKSLTASEIIINQQSIKSSEGSCSNELNYSKKIRHLDHHDYDLQEILTITNNHKHELQAHVTELLIPEKNTDNPKKYPLEDDSYRIIGIFVHKIFYNIVKKHLDPKNIFQNEGLIKNWRNRLLSEGIRLDKINEAVALVLKAIRNTLNDDVGQWILADYEVSFAEQPVYYQYQGQTKLSIIDRVFIDKDTIWIIDYKITEDHSENSEYQQQLEHYKYLIGKILHKQIAQHGYAIKTMLYYPLAITANCELICKS